MHLVIEATMTGKAWALIAVVIVAVAAAAVAIMLMTPGQDPVDPVDPDDPYVPEYPDGITYDSKTQSLRSNTSIVWKYTYMLVPFVDQVSVESEGKTLKLDSGYYKVTAKGETFDYIVDGTATKQMDWKYHHGDDVWSVHIEYDIDIRELAKIMIKNREYNNLMVYKFADLPNQVYVNDTYKSIASQLKTIYLDNGGDINDRQAYADFLIAFAEDPLGIKYPWADVQRDYRIWGVSEYWANSLETAFFGMGDCDDSAAVGCAILKAAGFKVAMVGVPGHVTASVALDSFEERDLSEYADIVKTVSRFTIGRGASVYGDDDTIYYGFDTTSGQCPVGYMIKSTVDYFGKDTFWGISGFYPVKD